jgi:hypothetical protein
MRSERAASGYTAAAAGFNKNTMIHARPRLGPDAQ